MSDKKYLFTSESVGEGHPDKVCDQVSDAVLDACLSDDPESHVACECYATTGMILIGGEITTDTYVDVQQLARDVVKEIGYTDPDYGMDFESMAVLNTIHAQSQDINQGVAGHGLKEYEGQQGAGDQGMMFGFACNETKELMPAPIMYAHRILERAATLRKKREIAWLRPDAKSQVTIEYEGHKLLRADTIVVSHQHDPEVDYPTIKRA
jgi:S-adenosylmethionine synthetase